MYLHWDAMSIPGILRGDWPWEGWVWGRNEHLWESGRSPDCGWVSRIHPFNRTFGFPRGFRVRSKKQRPCQDLEEVCYWQAVWLPSLCVGVCFHDFCNCPFIGETYTYDWQLITHPKDYSGEMEGKHSQIDQKIVSYLWEKTQWVLTPNSYSCKGSRPLKSKVLSKLACSYWLIQGSDWERNVCNPKLQL